MSTPTPPPKDPHPSSSGLPHAYHEEEEEYEDDDDFEEEIEHVRIQISEEFYDEAYINEPSYHGHPYRQSNAVVPPSTLSSPTASSSTSSSSSSSHAHARKPHLRQKVTRLLPHPGFHLHFPRHHTRKDRVEPQPEEPPAGVLISSTHPSTLPDLISLEAAQAREDIVHRLEGYEMVRRRPT